MVIWSVDVTIVEDTDWERMGSLSDVFSSAGRFIGVDFSPKSLPISIFK